MSLVKTQDDELWGERLAEKARDALKESSEKAKAEAEKMKKLGEDFGYCAHWRSNFLNFVWTICTDYERTEQSLFSRQTSVYQ